MSIFGWYLAARVAANAAANVAAAQAAAHAANEATERANAAVDRIGYRSFSLDKKPRYCCHCGLSLEYGSHLLCC